MNRNLLLALLAVAALAVAGAVYWFWPRPAPTLVAGDAWDYRLMPTDMPKDWAFEGQTLLTAYDLTASSGAGQDIITPTASLQNVQQLYSLRYAPPPTSEYTDFTLQILLYRTAAEAQAGLSAENPGAEWEPVDAPAVGDQTRVWHYRNPEPDLDQNIYRVDFRYLNAVGSVTVFGTPAVLPNANQPLDYARKVLAKMQARAEPPELSRLRSANLPDLRGLLLSQAQMSELDPAVNGHWGVNAKYLAAWVNNEDFQNPQARALLQQLGRITGYETYLITTPISGTSGTIAGYALFQQVSAYQPTESAPRGLKSMIGLEGILELTNPPQIGEATRAWRSLLKSKTSNDTIAISEIDFHVGPYVATVQLQSSPLTQDASPQQVLLDNYALARKLAEALAANLAAKTSP